MSVRATALACSWTKINCPPSSTTHRSKFPLKPALSIKRGNWVISASGGVQIESWALVDKAETADSLAPIRKDAETSAKTWWWN